MYRRSLRLPVLLRVVRCVLCKDVRVNVATPRLLSAAHFHTSPSRRDADSHSKGRSFVLQNPFRWLSLFFDFMYLKNQWDPEFNRSEFLEGCRQAISTVLSLIAAQRLDDLAGLVKREAVNKFVEQASEELGYRNTQHLKDPDEVVALPHKVTLQSIVDQKYCDIEVNFIVLKKLDQVRSEGPRLLMCFIFAKFHRNYTAGRLPDWTITDLSLQRASSVD